ncbi:hypothetical protein [Paraliomyxa miuraensis]|uniref:hypothetical protein n=1 Tax=Paraliomyxa miuraensis TaxID=376150 RepID=UPI00225A0162|nr:hypothetical protein [Paraliomyxa miuraensis]MCX4243638.1 hypothetical protein [Paraliomyxa miuraensis]
MSDHGPLHGPLLRALMEARGDVPPSLARFDALVRSDGPPPSFEEYSARMGAALCPWRQTCYFDARARRRLTSVANARFEKIAADLGVSIPASFWRFLAKRGAHGSEVREVVLGMEATVPLRLKYYLVFRGPAASTVEALRVALGAPELPATLHMGSVCILGLDFHPCGLHDFKVYVRLDSRRLPHVIENFADFRALAVGCRYLVFQHCVVSRRRQVYFHANSPAVLEDHLALDPRAEGARGSLADTLARMNRRLEGRDAGVLRPWIASFVYRQGALEATPANIYFHLGRG